MGLRSVALAASALVCAALAGTAGAQPLVPAMYAPFVGATPSAADVARLHRAGVQVLRLILPWDQVAPGTRAAGFDAANPADPGYAWSKIDAAVTSAVKNGFEPILDVTGAPAWGAEAPATTDSKGFALGPVNPDANALAQFAVAAATRYGGDLAGLPRVRYWQLYNEPNFVSDLRPQVVHGQPISPELYRRMVNLFAAAVHGVHADNLVVAGGLTPFTFSTAQQRLSIAPLRFMRELLCMSAGAHPHPTCSGSVAFDVWAHHPYTSGGPTHKATELDDVSLGNLPAMKRLLDAAYAAGEIDSRSRPQFWVTEFSWDSNPPDPKAVPLALLDRWVPQAMYQMWRNGVSLVTWFSLRDQAFPSAIQAGLYYRDGKPKPYLRGFRFPFVAFPRAKGVYVWGRTPTGRKATVTLQQRTAGRWRRVATVQTDASGIFRRTLKLPRTGHLRALVKGDRSLPFGLAAVPDRGYDPFGS